MKSLIVIAVLLGAWMSVDGASVITPDSSVWSSNTSMAEMQNECVAKISQNEDVMIDILNVKFTFLGVFIKMIQEIRMQNSLDSLDSMINNICYPALDRDMMYSLTMNIARICLNQIDNFTNQEKKMIKSQLERVFCSVYMKLAAIITFSPDCISNEAALTEISKCATQESVNSEKSFRNWFFGDPETCMRQSKILDCVKQAIRGQCSAVISEQIASTLFEAKSILGCEAEQNSVDVINSLER